MVGGFGHEGASIGSYAYEELKKLSHYAALALEVFTEQGATVASGAPFFSSLNNVCFHPPSFSTLET